MIEQILNRENLNKWQQKSLFPFWLLPKNINLKSRARELRKQGVLSEVIFWSKFKDKSKIYGYDIDRQIVIGNYIVDFFIPELGLVIEINGSSHDNKQEYDTIRENFLGCHDLLELNYSDREIKKNINGVEKDFKMQIIEREEYLRDYIVSHST